MDEATASVIGRRRAPERRMFIDGAWVEAAAGETFDSIDPATGRILAGVPRGRAADTSAALLSGHSFGSWTTWAAAGAAVDPEALAGWCAGREAGCSAEETEALLAGLGDPRIAAASPMRTSHEYGSRAGLWASVSARAWPRLSVPIGSEMSADAALPASAGAAESIRMVADCKKAFMV